jgi:hypothetical protein
MVAKPFVWRCLCMVLLLVSMVAAPVMADPGKDEAHGTEGKGKHEKHRGKAKDGESRGYDGYFPEQGYTTLDIPPGHLPPPGQCRLWYPDRPPGHQPPPQSCGYLRAHAPALDGQSSPQQILMAKSVSQELMTLTNLVSSLRRT